MLRKSLMATFSLIVPFLMSQHVSAQGGPVMTKCKDDIAKFCADKPHVGRQIRTCLEAKKDELTPECKEALDTTGPGKGGKGGKGQGMKGDQSP